MSTPATTPASAETPEVLFELLPPRTNRPSTEEMKYKCLVCSDYECTSGMLDHHARYAHHKFTFNVDLRALRRN